jgi:hypothetical protein
MEKVIQEFRIIETDDGFRIEIKGDKEQLREFVMGFDPRRWMWRGRGRRGGWGPFAWGWGDEDDDEDDDRPRRKRGHHEREDDAV